MTGQNNMPSAGWFKATRFAEMPQLVKSSRTAFIVAYAIAFRARWNDSAFNPFNLAPGEAVCDYVNWGLTEQEFRNGRDKLTAWGYATFRATNRGTIGKLVDTRLFSVLPFDSNGQSNEPSNEQTTNGTADKQRAGQRHTKTKDQKSKDQKTRKELRGLRHARFPSSLDELKRHAETKGYSLEKEVLPWLRMNNDGNWAKDGKPLRRWKGALHKYVTDFARNSISGVSPVPKNWVPEIIQPQ